ncbi:MAG: GNAT family N-acetyltransferase [Planctomycetes bacterium]|nr:GNAT family N-acetyltransferase [Planctomycetota bacterium]
MCRLRDYRHGDEQGVFQIVKEVLADYGLSTNPEVTDADLKDIDRFYISCGGTFKVLESDGRIVGSYGLYPETASCCELRKMYLLPEFQGCGLGKKMLEDALSEARALGFSEMTLETNSCLKKALGLYRSYGFREFTPDHLSDRCDIAMKREL